MHGSRRHSRGGLRNVNDATGLWVDTAREFGNPVPEPKGERHPPTALPC